MNDLLDIVPDLIWQKGAEGVYLHCNHALAQFYGATKAEIIGRTAFDFFPSDQARVLQAQDMAILETGESLTHEEWVSCPSDGRHLLFESKRAPLIDETGNVIGVLGIARDITSRRAMEGEANFLRELVEFSADPIFALDLKDGFQMKFANQATCKHFGVSKSELLKMRAPDWNQGLSHEKLDTIRSELISGKSQFFETLHRRKDGSIVPVEVSANYLLHAGQHLAAGYIRDISRRKAAEAELLASHKKLIDITSNVPCVIYELSRSKEGKYSFPFIGNTAEKFFGVKPEQLCEDFSLTHPEDIEGLYGSIEESAQTLRPWYHEYRIILPCEGVRWVLGNAFPSKGEDGSVLWHGYLVDLTKVKLTESALQQSQDQLRQLIGHQDRIREDERKRVAKDIHDELGQHLLAMKIDISMLPQLAGEPSALNEGVEAIMEQIDSKVKAVRAIINDLRPSVLDLGLFAALEWQIGEFQQQSGIACVLVGNEEELQLDDRQATSLFRIMQEALNNVQQHASASQVRVELRVLHDEVVLKIADDGVGVSDGGMDHNKKFGLASIRERIGMLDGSAKLESNNGTVLSVSLPLKTQGQLPFS